jgi:hypothetical protein
VVRNKWEKEEDFQGTNGLGAKKIVTLFKLLKVIKWKMREAFEFHNRNGPLRTSS